MIKKITVWLIVLVAILGSGYFIWENRYPIHDYIVLIDYKPPATISALANDDTFTTKGKNDFYVNKPQISDRAVFNTECKSPEQTIVLGCYTGTNIYIFSVNDPRLNGVEQVTAAHEMLHAAYDRLSSSERNKIDALLIAELTKLNDPRINAEYANYAKTEPGQQLNELHSVLGTEVSNIGPQLEAYYSQYFSDRSKIVAYSNQYEQVFNDIQNQAEQDDAQLALMKAEIDQLESSLQSQNQQLNVTMNSLDSLEASGQTVEYNSQVPAYNNSVNSYNSSVANLKSLINQYNNLLNTRNSLTVQQQSLDQSIDSQLNAIPTK